MITPQLSRRDLLGTTTYGLAALSALPATTLFLTADAHASSTRRCIETHRQMAEELGLMLDDPSMSLNEMAYAQKTCRCPHCDVAIAPGPRA